MNLFFKETMGSSKGRRIYTFLPIQGLKPKFQGYMMIPHETRKSMLKQSMLIQCVMTLMVILIESIINNIG